MGHGGSGLAHFVQARRIVEELGDFPSGGGKIVATDRGASFEEMVSVAEFLARDGLDERHGQVARERFRGGESAGFSNQQIRRGHVLVHLSGEADRNETRRAAWQSASGTSDFVEALFHFFR